MSLKEDTIKHQRDQSLRSFKFNRFLLIRYSLALFFFVNLYWAVFNLFTNWVSALIPLALLVVSLFAVGEQISLYWHHDNLIPKTKLYFTVQLIANIALMAVVWLESIFNYIFPFLSYNTSSLYAVYAILAVGALFSVIIGLKIQRINNNQDKKFELIKKYERTINGA